MGDIVQQQKLFWSSLFQSVAIFGYVTFNNYFGKRKPVPPPVTPSQGGSQSTSPTGPGHGESQQQNQKNQKNQQSEKSGAQDKKLSSAEIRQLEQNTRQSAEDIKGDIVGKRVSKYDLYKNADGEIVVKPKGGKGPGEPTGYTTEDLKPPTEEQR